MIYDIKGSSDDFNELIHRRILRFARNNGMTYSDSVKWFATLGVSTDLVLGSHLMQNIFEDSIYE